MEDVTHIEAITPIEDLEIYYLPLKPFAAYNYNYVIDRVSYNFRFYYNTLMEKWIYDIRYSDGTPLVLGRRLTPLTPLTSRYSREFDGYLYLMPVGNYQLNTVENPFEIHKYFDLVYVKAKEE